ncbi:PLP-dependent aminotransferase family protein [Fulvivirga sp.]|uniref:aminotransferase-like domain-containing protein n=1 Tax=Fulvivirga sp. TaxID=1931237 RepID=UPI0032EC27C4
MMLPYKTILYLNNESRTPKYVQITNEFIKHITNGIVSPGLKLPGTRQLSQILNVNRRTVTAAYEELAAQGWIVINPNQGCYVKEKLPEIKPKSIGANPMKKETEKVFFELSIISDRKDQPKTIGYDFVVNDGYPDIRLAPLKELARNYSYISGSSLSNNLMTYRQRFYGDEVLRLELVKYLAETRSIQVDIENIMTTRGSLMAFHVLFKTILTSRNNQVIVGYPGFNEGYEAIKLAGGELNYVAVDNQGLDIDEVERLCMKKKICAIFIIPHHHYPTTVSLSASRRMELLQLAEKYGFAIVEDDYDYDFHYSGSPVLPLASTDYNGSVAYVGSFSKTVAPSLRLGFIVAPKNLIREVSFVSRYIDSFGNIAMERAVAMLFKEGSIRRHLRKALNAYRQRRDHFCGLLETELGDYIHFEKPEGGLAIWAQLKNVDLNDLIKSGEKHRLKISNESGFNFNQSSTNSLRIGFASMTVNESKNLISILKTSMLNIDK